jgi:hypothetical protein
LPRGAAAKGGVELDPAVGDTLGDSRTFEGADEEASRERDGLMAVTATVEPAQKRRAGAG